MKEKIISLFSQIFTQKVKYSNGEILTIAMELEDVEQGICKIENCNLEKARKIINYARRNKLLIAQHSYSHNYKYRPTFECGELFGEFK